MWRITRYVPGSTAAVNCSSRVGRRCALMNSALCPNRCRAALRAAPGAAARAPPARTPDACPSPRGSPPTSRKCPSHSASECNSPPARAPELTGGHRTQLRVISPRAQIIEIHLVGERGGRSSQLDGSGHPWSVRRRRCCPAEPPWRGSHTSRSNSRPRDDDMCALASFLSERASPHRRDRLAIPAVP